MADEPRTQRRSTAVPHSGAVPSIPSLEPEADAAPRAPFNDPMPRARDDDSETRSPSRLQPELDPAPAAPR